MASISQAEAGPKSTNCPDRRPESRQKLPVRPPTHIAEGPGFGVHARSDRRVRGVALRPCRERIARSFALAYGATRGGPHNERLLKAAGAELAAERAVRTAERAEALAQAAELQATALKGIEDLLEELAEWDNFQNVLALTRDILNRQKALRERTQQFASGK
jgi:hypothetical protein